jgi:hypothetical protein
MVRAKLRAEVKKLTEQNNKLHCDLKVLQGLQKQNS